MFALADFIWEDEASRCYELPDGENGPRPVFYTGIAAKTTTAIFPVKNR